MTILMALLAAAAGIYALTVFILGKPVPGFTTIMIVMTGSFFGAFSILAVIIKYLSVIIDLIFKRKEKIVESVERL
jgi:dolichol-phosphate mannosyltransferase